MINTLKNLIRPIYIPLWNYKKKIEFEKSLSICKQKGLPIKIVLGSADIHDTGWIPSEVYILNLLDDSTWNKYFKESEIDSLIAEHVWEHLTAEEGLIAAKMCYKYLKKGGYLRIAVPDGFHVKQEYIDYVKPGGLGAGADDHKLLYNYNTFSSVFSQAGFQINLLEYFDEQKQFHFKEWNIKEGTIRRSIRYDERNKDGNPNYTSIILDAQKK